MISIRRAYPDYYLSKALNGKRSVRKNSLGGYSKELFSFARYWTVLYKSN
jgi:hypothetical protein